MTHTKEPWHCTADGEIASVTGEIIGDTLDTANHEENQRRIVACVNACGADGAVTRLAKTLIHVVERAYPDRDENTDLHEIADMARALLADLGGGGNQPLRVQIYPLDQDTGTRGPLHWEGEFNAEVIEDDEERAEVEAKLRESGVAMVGGGAMPLVLILRADG